MNVEFSSIAKWAVAFAATLSAAMAGYSLGHKGPPVTYADWWDFASALFFAVATGTAGRSINVGIQKAQGKKPKDDNDSDA